MNSVEYLKKLISFDTTSCYSNLDLIQFIQDVLNSHRIPCRLTHDSTKTKFNLFATFPSLKDDQSGGLILSGHTDVVPIDGQCWDTDPFIATIKDERLYGRGASDMKGFIAVVMALIPEFLKLKLKKPLHFAFSYDEEVGCFGAPIMIQDFLSHGIHPAACIVGEPTELRPVIAHKGIQAFRCSVNGLARHSSLTTEGCNAIEFAAELIGKICEFSSELKHTVTDSDYDVPFTTITNNLISGGRALNIIPNECEFTFEYRNLANVNPKNIISKIENIKDDVLNKMQQIYPDASIELISLGRVPAFEASETATITQLLNQLTHTTKRNKVSYATEAGIFQQANIPTILWGPGRIKEAHRPNEFIALEQLSGCEKILINLVNQFLAL